jgi:DinB superfamily
LSNTNTPITHSINQTLLDLLQNQIDRTRFALLDLDPDVFTRDPGGGCNSIRNIGKHLVMLRGFQLLLMQSDLRNDMPDDQIGTVDELVRKLDAATALVRQAIESHDPADWHAEPTEPREGPWAELPTLIRLVRPMNDFTNHLGGIRTIRRIMGNPADKTQ